MARAETKPRHAVPLIGRGPSDPADGLPLFSIGFRPFFLLAALAAAALVPCWLAMLLLGARWPSPFLPILWHSHEMLFGYTSAVIAGFLLTATQNWTGQVTARGGLLVALVALWLAGRLTCAFGAELPTSVAAAIDLAFLPATALFVAIPIARTRNRRNAMMPVVLLVLTGANALWWFAAVTPDALSILRAQRIALDVVALLILVIGGRIIPGFTANAVAGVRARPRSALDVAAIAAMVVLLASDAIAPRSQLASVFAALAALLNTTRLWGWGGSRCWNRPILWVLHVGFGCTAAALGLRAIALQTTWLAESTATHLLTVGGIGLMTLGMMARVALGHTGRPLVLARTTVVAFFALAASALLRVFGPIVYGRGYVQVLWASAALWTLAFGLYLVHYTPILLAPRADAAVGPSRRS